MIKLTPLLHDVAAGCDGRRDAEQVAAVVSERFGRGVSAANVRQLAEEQLRPLGVLAQADGTTPELPKRQALLALRHRRPIVSRAGGQRDRRRLRVAARAADQGASCSLALAAVRRLAVRRSTASRAGSAPCSTSPPGCSPLLVLDRRRDRLPRDRPRQRLPLQRRAAGRDGRRRLPDLARVLLRRHRGLPARPPRPPAHGPRRRLLQRPVRPDWPARRTSRRARRRCCSPPSSST